jgi:hypothetical protein
MSEVLIGTTPTIRLDVSGGTITGTPTAVVNFSGTTASPAVTQDTIPDGLTDRRKITLPLQASQSQGEVRVDWTFIIGGVTYQRSDHLEVVAPLLSPIAAAEELGFSLDPSDQNYRSERELLSAERTARYAIESYTGETFGNKQDTVAAHGTGSDVLWVGMPIISFSRIEEDNVVIYEDGESLIGYNLELTESSQAIRVSDAINISETGVQSVGSLRTFAFKAGKRYEVTGSFGYPYIPSRVKQASALLINDFLCQDSNWRARYVKRAEMRDWKFTLSSQAFYGTGNAIADSLLDEYRSVHFTVI